MRIFLTGATGVLGRSLVPRLLGRGHSVVGTSSRKEGLQQLEQMGVEPVLMDGLDRASVVGAVMAAQPDVVVNEMTALANVRDYKNFDKEFALTNRLRGEGTAYLLEGAKASGAQRIVVQSFAGWPLERGKAVANPEGAPYEKELPEKMRKSGAAIRGMEEMVLASEEPAGVVLRYGFFYGPGTSFDADGETTQAVRKGGLPLVGGGTAVWSLIHIEDAAEATRLAIEGAPAGAYHVTDDHPAAVHEWLAELARVLDAKPPKHVPALLAKLAVGDAGVYLMTKTRGALNAKAKSVLDWKLAYPDWREGFATSLGAEASLTSRGS
ncbi:MAG: NAD(P)-dependent oxidoreductase [Acidobacteriota bacterium]